MGQHPQEVERRTKTLIDRLEVILKYEKPTEYDGRLKSSYADQDTLMEYDQVRLILFFFNIVSFAVHTFFYSCCSVWIPLWSKKVINNRYDFII